MYLKFSQPFLLALLALLVVASQATKLVSSPNLEFDQRLYDALNFTRSKRQLFREDIPHHRPLSGNHYAVMHGFPHPGRWADGTRNPYRPTGNLPTPHQAYFDMLDGGRAGRYHTGIFGGSGGGSGGGHSGGGKGVSFGNELVHGISGGSGGSEFGLSGFGGDDHDAPLIHQSHYNPPPPPKQPSYEYESGKGHQYGAPPHVNVQIHGNFPENRPAYGPPQEKPHSEEPKAIVHYHPIQYSQVLNIPESPQPSYGSPPHNSNSYGPPGHQSGAPIGIEGGFIPSKGISYHEEVPQKLNYHTEQGGSSGPYRFDPFKIFSHNKPPRDNDAPIPIPILAQFHTSKPIKFTKLKEPIHIIYRHPPPHQPIKGPHHHGGPPQRPHFLHNLIRRPKFPPPPPDHPDWFYSHR